jgi:hypothetical protein
MVTSPAVRHAPAAISVRCRGRFYKASTCRNPSSSSQSLRPVRVPIRSSRGAPVDCQKLGEVGRRVAIQAAAVSGQPYVAGRGGHRGDEHGRDAAAAERIRLNDHHRATIASAGTDGPEIETAVFMGVGLTAVMPDASAVGAPLAERDQPGLARSDSQMPPSTRPSAIAWNGSNGSLRRGAPGPRRTRGPD